MPILRDFERRLGGLIEGLFSKTFRSGVQPVELAKRILKEQDAWKTVGVNEVWAPNRFVFRLAEEDLERFRQAEAALLKELRNVVRDNAAERGWGLVGPPQVQLVADSSLKRGDLTCAASLAGGEPSADADKGGGLAPVRRVHPSLVVHEKDERRTVEIDKEVVTIGRLPECDVVLRDPGASRRHAQIRSTEGALVLVDLGSTNGTRLNGQTVQTRELSDGDHITIGTTLLEFHEG